MRKGEVKQRTDWRRWEDEKLGRLEEKEDIEAILADFSVRYLQALAPDTLYETSKFLFRFDRPFFWPAAGLTPETWYLNPSFA